MSSSSKKDVLKMKVKIVSIGAIQTFKDGDFRKQELIGEVQEGEYTNVFCFEFLQDKVKLLEDLIPNTNVTILYNIRCRKVERDGSEPMYFTSLQGWKIEV
jgi:hypothetical protein